MKIYGIPNCGSVKKALDFVKRAGLEYEFIDFKKQKPSAEQIEKWADAVSMDKLFNTKGTKYKSSGLNYKELDRKQKIESLASEPTMIKRPVIEFKDKLIVGFDIDEYQRFFLY